MTRRLHFTIGPVQGFVARSRRTRDLWSSSYLLSFLSAHAIAGARRAGGRIVELEVESDPLLAWVEHPGQRRLPDLGSLPNHFAADADDPTAVAREAEDAFRVAWRRVCDAVWSEFVVGAAELGRDTRQIWARQTEGFWELVWVVADPEETGALARRKQWRTTWPEDEPGDRCFLMPDLQELSGYIRAREREKQAAFWKKVRSAGRVGRFDLEENERLSAVGLVKRLYPKVALKALGGEIHQDLWRWPSTSDVAATPWCRRLLAAAPDEAREYARAVRRLVPDSSPGGVARLLGEVRPEDREFARLDAAWLYRSFLGSVRAATVLDEDGRKELDRRLQGLGDRVEGNERLGAPPTYFALLVADGDRLGARVATHGGATVSRALARFTRDVPEMVEREGGVTVYAGGDDVLALLPLDRALHCARSLERLYREAFAAEAGRRDHGATLSAAVVFAQVHAPLGLVVQEARRLLDDVAKEANGRDSVAAGIYRNSGPAARWVSTWRPEAAGPDAVERVEEVASELRSGDLSPSLLERLRLALGLLTDNRLTGIGTFGPVAPGVDLEPFVRAEVAHALLRNGGSGHEDHVVERSEEIAGKIVRLLRRAPAGGGEAAEFGLDGLLIAKLLAGGGSEEEH